MKRLNARLTAPVAALALAACAAGLGRVPDIEVSTVAVRATQGAAASDVAARLMDAGARFALVASPADSAWFAEVAGATSMNLSGPADAGDLRIGFLGDEPAGDTTVVLSWDGGSLVVRDALYEVREDRFLDLLAFRVADGASARAATAALVQYMATDVMNSAAVVMAVAVPSAAVGDSVARFLSPAYFDALRCEPGLAAPSERAGLRLFYGPEARVYCRSATAEAGSTGDMVRAELVLGRRN